MFFDVSIPKGHIIVPEKDRLIILHSLEKQRQVVLKKLVAFPAYIGLENIRKLKNSYELKLGEINKGIKIFSYSKPIISTALYDKINDIL